LDHVSLEPRRAKINTAIINCHGLAAENSTLIVKRAK